MCHSSHTSVATSTYDEQIAADTRATSGPIVADKVSFLG